MVCRGNERRVNKYVCRNTLNNREETLDTPLLVFRDRAVLQLAQAARQKHSHKDNQPSLFIYAHTNSRENKQDTGDQRGAAEASRAEEE